MSQKISSQQQSIQTPEATGPSSMVQSRDMMQDLVGNQAILAVMNEELSADECSRYEMWVPEVQRCLDTGAAPQSAMGNALMAIIGTKLLGLVTGGVLGTTVSTPMIKAVMHGAAAQFGGALGSALEPNRGGGNTESAEDASESEASQSAE